MLFAIGIVVWVLMIVCGLGALTLYASTPGPASAGASQWPAGDKLPALSGDRYTLVMTVHPRCPCSRASVAELEVLMARCSGQLDAYVVFSNPPGMTGPIPGNGLWEMASRLPGVRAIRDEDASIARHLGAETSGQTYLYDKTGAVLFQGGITAARGHVGDNDGRSAIEAIIHRAATAAKLTPTFGCTLQ